MQQIKFTIRDNQQPISSHSDYEWWCQWSLLSRNTGVWTELWMQPALHSKTRSKSSLVLSWNQSCVKTYVGLRNSAASFQGILETLQISQTIFILPLKQRILVHHVHWTLPVILFSVQRFTHKDPRHTYTATPRWWNPSSCISSWKQGIDSQPSWCFQPPSIGKQNLIFPVKHSAALPHKQCSNPQLKRGRPEDELIPEGPGIDSVLVSMRWPTKMQKTQKVLHRASVWFVRSELL